MTHAGHDLLPPSFEEDREELLLMVAAGYAALGDKVDNFKHWHRAMAATVGTIKERFQALGLEAAPWTEAALWARIDLPCPSPTPLEHMRLLRALLTNFHEPFYEQYEYRRRTGGNVHLRWCGPTGMAKSSCAITVMHDTSPIAPEKLVDHLCIDIGELPDKLKGKPPGAWVHMDELLVAAGEGSRTQGALMGNLEDTIRASQINLSASSPQLEDTATTQAQAEVILWNPRRQWSLFLVWVKGVPMGVVGIPWMPTEHYRVYAPWKTVNVERSIQAQFSDNNFLARMVAKCCEDARFVKFMSKTVNKPKLKDFKTALTLFQPQMMASTTSDKLADFMHDLFYGWDRIGGDLKAWFGIDTSPGMEAIAKKCYAE